MKDKNIYLWIPHDHFELYYAMEVQRHELNILKELVKNNNIILKIKLN